MDSSKRYLAHSANGNDKGEPEPLHVHLKAVSTLAAEFAKAFGAEQQAYAAGLLHDLGKYADQFQRRLANPKKERGRDHWTAGAALISALPVRGSWAKYRLMPASVMKASRKTTYAG